MDVDAEGIELIKVIPFMTNVRLVCYRGSEESKFNSAKNFICVWLDVHGFVRGLALGSCPSWWYPKVAWSFPVKSNLLSRKTCRHIPFTRGVEYLPWRTNPAGLWPITRWWQMFRGENSKAWTRSFFFTELCLSKGWKFWAKFLAKTSENPAACMLFLAGGRSANFFAKVRRR